MFSIEGIPYYTLTRENGLEVKFERLKGYSIMECKAQDSAGKICGKTMTKEEIEQDGMCQWCADNIWEEMQVVDYQWYHKDKV